MPRFIAFLRAINVGGHIVKMDDLRTNFQAMGFSNVETFIASGNVIFESKSGNTKSLEQQIEKQLYKTLGYGVATFIRTRSELVTIAEYKPFSEEETSAAGAINVAFLADPLAEDKIKALMTLETEIDKFRFHGREVYWLCLKKQSESKFSNAVFERALNVKSTFRGARTISRLVARYAK